MNYRRFLIVLVVATAGCFYPPPQKPLRPNNSEVVVPIAYDLAWQAVHDVIASNNYNIITENPDQGFVEAQSVGTFTLADADCGMLKGIAGKYKSEPDPDASVVYDFTVKPQGNEASVVGVRATFSTPLHVPLHPVSDEQCMSRGTQEARLLKQISRQATKEHRPQFKPQSPPDS